jgi:hypothetical protein
LGSTKRHPREGFNGDQPHPAIGYQGDKDNGCLASSTAILNKKKKTSSSVAHHFLVWAWVQASL